MQNQENNCRGIEELVEENFGLISFVVHRLIKVPEYLHDDCISIAAEYLLHAARTYNPEKSKFSYWAVLQMKYGVYAYLRKERDIALLTDNSGISVDDIEPHVEAPSAETIVLDVLLVEDIEKIATPSELEVLRLVADGYTQKEISLLVCKPVNTVRYLLESARKKTRSRNA